jgi:hypothetical protein
MMAPFIIMLTHPSFYRVMILVLSIIYLLCSIAWAPCVLAGIWTANHFERQVVFTAKRSKSIAAILFIARWTVHTWNRKVIKTQINAQVRAVMNNVVEDKTADHRLARHRHPGDTRFQQRPGCIDPLIVKARQCLSGRGDVTIKLLQNFPSAGKGRDLIGLPADWRNILKRAL